CRYKKNPRKTFEAPLAARVAQELGRDIRELDNYDWSDLTDLFNGDPPPPKLGDNVLLTLQRSPQLALFARTGGSRPVLRVARSTRHNGTATPTRSILAAAHDAVMISYCRSGKDGPWFADSLRSNLITAGFRPWMDIHDLEGGDQWPTAIANAIRCCAAVVLV